MWTEAVSSTGCECGPEAIPWIRDWFMDCVSSPVDVLGFLVGISSIIFWIIAQLPQFIQNIQCQSAEALSPWFLFQWLTGDTLNLLGCILTGDQLATETFTACYFIFADCCIISQYVYYHIRNKSLAVGGGERRIPAKYTALNSLGPDSVHGPLPLVTGRSGAVMIAHASMGGSSTGNAAVGHLQAAEKWQNAVGVSKGDVSFLRRKGLNLMSRGNVSISSRAARVIAKYGLEYGPLVHKKLSMKHRWQMQHVTEKGESSSALRPENRTVLGAKDGGEQGVRRKGSGLKAQGRLYACVTGVLVLTSWLRGSTTGTSGLWTWSTTEKPLVPAGQDSSLVNRKLMEVKLITGADPLTVHPGTDRLRIPCGDIQQSPGVRAFGLVLGWGSVAFYLSSRVSQIVLNFQRKSAEGLSMAMFICAFTANLAYGTAILLRASSVAELAGKAPWLVGSMGTLSLDVTIFFQAQYLESRHGRTQAHQTPLLVHVV